MTIEACAAEACKTATYGQDEEIPQRFFVEIEDVESGLAVGATIRVSGPTSDIIVEEQWDWVPLDQELRPNGATCPPTCYVGRVRVEV